MRNLIAGIGGTVATLGLDNLSHLAAAAAGLSTAAWMIVQIFQACRKKDENLIRPCPICPLKKSRRE